MTNATFSSGPALGRRVETARLPRIRPTARQTTAAALSRTICAVRTLTWPARLLIGAGIAMVPWLVYLAATLPSAGTTHWDAIWAGFDAVEAAGLIATGVLLHLGDARHSLTAAATAILFATDAWFDCGTAVGGADRLVALAMAIGLELPLAAVLGVLAWRAFPRP